MHALLTLLSLMNAVLLGALRILVAIGRDGLFMEHAARVGTGGAPVTAMLLSAGMAGLLAGSGRFDEIIAISAILVAGMYAANYVAVSYSECTNRRWRGHSGCGDIR